MRVLLLRRQRFGGVTTLTDLLAEALDREDIEAVVDDADWIPDETGPKTDRKVGKVVRAACRGFDLVHAFGFRAAWACSAALTGGRPWIYTAHDMPRTVHPLLIESLNAARAGVCSSEACMAALADANAKRLSVVRPGVPLHRRRMDREENRAMLGVQPDEFLLVAAGRFVPEHALGPLVQAVGALPAHVRLIISGKGPEEAALRDAAGPRVEITTEPFAQQGALAAADLAVVPSVMAGFSLSAVEAMYQGVPALMRRTGGLPEIAVDQETGYLFETDEEMLDMLGHLCHKPEEVHAVGEAARERVLARFDLARTAKEYADIYRRVAKA